MALKIFVPNESRSGENRAALTPSVVKQLIAEGFECYIEPGAGNGAGFSDKVYQDSGAVVAGQSATWGTADVVLKVNPPSPEEIGQMKKGAALISMMYAFWYSALGDACRREGVSAYALDAVPRICRAQKMDVLSW